MSHEILLCIYVGIWIAQIVMLCRRWNSPQMGSWLWLYGFEILSLVVALFAMHYYNEHPGWLGSTLGHFLWSMGAAVAYFIMLLLTAVMQILRTTVLKK